MVRRFLLLPALLVASLAIPGTGAVAGSSDYQQVVDITFPFAEGVDPDYGDHYDDDRSGGRVHKATDLMVAYGTPVHAVRGGEIVRIKDDGPESHYYIVIAGDDGREYHYMHLGRNYGPHSEAYAHGMKDGVRVQRGQLIGYAGCSGNAYCGSGGHHLHLEIHDPRVTDKYGSAQINPVHSLEAAEDRRDYPVKGPFADVPPSSTHAADIEELANERITLGCNPSANTRFCPGDGVTRQQMASFLARALDLEPTDASFRDVPPGNAHAGDIGALAKARITMGCNPPANDRFCPGDVVTREQMASFISRAKDLAPRDESFSDVGAGNVHREAIGALAHNRITLGCNPPSNDRFCPKDTVTRAQMASFLVRAFVN